MDIEASLEVNHVEKRTRRGQARHTFVSVRKKLTGLKGVEGSKDYKMRSPEGMRLG